MQSQVNRPLCSYNPAKRDGACNIDNLGSLPNYIPGDQKDEKIIAAGQYEQAAHEQWAGTVLSFDSTVGPEDFVQPREFWEVTLGKDPDQQERLVGNVAASLSKADKGVRSATYGM